MKKRKRYSVYAPQIVDGEHLRVRVLRMSQESGKKIYQIAKEAMEIGLAKLEEKENAN